MLEILKSLVMGIIQGITEWLPISSTGHMILVNDFFPMQVYQDAIQNKEFVDMFMVVIQLGSILAVLLLYYKKLNPFKKNKVEQRSTIDLWLKVAVAAIPAAVAGILFDDVIDSVLYKPSVVALMLIIYGVAFLWIESRKNKVTIKTIEAMSFQTAFLIGVFQMLALVPGTSRSGATILGAVLLGCMRPVAAEFSFFLAIPMMFGASLVKLIKMKIALDLFGLTVLLVGTITAFVVSVVVIKGFMSYIRKHDFKLFGYYRIVLGGLILLNLIL